MTDLDTKAVERHTLSSMLKRNTPAHWDFVCGDDYDALAAERDRLQAEVERLTTNASRFPDLMARILAAKSEGMEPRIERLIAAMEKLPASLPQYQWEANDKPLFGDKRISVCGDNGRGTGRQYLADTPSHIDGLAEYIAAANPDTIAMLIATVATIPAKIAAARVEMREAAAKKVPSGVAEDVKRAILSLPIPDTDALQSALDRVFDEGIEAAAEDADTRHRGDMPKHIKSYEGIEIRALKRSGKGAEGC